MRMFGVEDNLWVHAESLPQIGACIENVRDFLVNFHDLVFVCTVVGRVVDQDLILFEHLVFD